MNGSVEVQISFSVLLFWLQFPVSKVMIEITILKEKDSISIGLI